MKIQLISDIHLNFADLELPGGDVLILAGDAMEVGHIRLAENAGRNVFLVDRYKRFFAEEFAKYQHVIYVSGNHEHYHGYYETNNQKLKSLLPDNVHHLENESVEIDGVHFWGATTWTDMHGRDPLTMSIVQNSMNDFRLIRFEHGHQRHGRWTDKFSVYDAIEENQYSVQQMQKFLAEHENDACVIINHHAPSAQSVNPRYSQDHHINGGYHNNFDAMIQDNPQIKLFVHGHMHLPCRYYIGETLIASNPRGYHGHEPQAENYQPKTIDLDAMPTKQEVEQDRFWER